MNQKEYQMKVNGVVKNVIQAIDSYQLLDEQQINTIRKMLLTSLDSAFITLIEKDYNRRNRY